MMLLALAAQTQDATLQALQRIATAQVVMAAVMLGLALVAFGGVVVVMIQTRRLMRGVNDTLDEVRPRLVPLIDRARSVTDDVSMMTDGVRRRVDDVMHTVEDIHRGVQRGNEELEARVKRFAAVLDVVQAEAEELLLDAAATARGVHETARLLRDTPPAGRRGRQRSGTHRDNETGAPPEDEP